MAIWLPGYDRVNLGLSGKPFEYTHNPKGLLHSTEGTSLSGAEQAMRAYPSHLGYDYRTREKHQYISLDLAAYSAMDESDNDPIYQVELVGFAKDMRYLPDWALARIAIDVIKPLADTIGIPPTIIGHGFKDGLDGIYPYLASPQSPIRLSYAQLRAFSGWLGHQHLPAPDDHWDPGAINMARLIALAYGDDDLSAEEVFSKVLAIRHGDGTTHAATFKDVIEHLELGEQIKFDKINDRFDAIEAKINTPAPVQMTEADRQAIAATVRSGLVAEVARAVVAEFKKEGN